MRFYFHVKDGSTILDDEGSEFPSVEAVKNNAIRASGEMLRGLDHKFLVRRALETLGNRRSQGYR